ncbi:MAG TPA: hypothetical protein VFB99_24720 [Vicinamibacterales bacterium]|nr:hypothetical protein [Vicinamibacterales bacterium]
MGLGLHAAARPDFNDYELSKLPVLPGEVGLPMDFVPRDAPQHVVERFKAEFAIWIAGCGLRELLEHYALFVDHVHRAGLVVLHSRGLESALGDPKKLHANFHRTPGVPAKLAMLADRFGMAPDKPEYISSLYKARNCLTHGVGVVTPQNADANGELRLRWLTLEVYARGEETGQIVPPRTLIGKVTTEPMSIEGKQVEREKVFKTGEQITLTQQDLWEICYFFNANCIPTLVRSMAEFFQKHGVPINAPHP